MSKRNRNLFKNAKKRFIVAKKRPQTAREYIAKISRFNFSNDKRTYICIISATQTFASILAGNYASTFPLNHPTYYRNESTTWGQLGGRSAHYANLLTMFDMYKVLSMRVTFYPNFVDTQSVGTDVPVQIYMIHDKDDTVNLTTDAQVLTMGRRPSTMTGGKPVTYIIRQTPKVPYVNVATLGVDSGAAAAQGTMVYPDFYQSIKVWLPNLTANTNYGRYVVDWVVKWAGFQSRGP